MSSMDRDGCFTPSISGHEFLKDKRQKMTRSGTLAVPHFADSSISQIVELPRELSGSGLTTDRAPPALSSRTLWRACVRPRQERSNRQTD